MHLKSLASLAIVGLVFSGAVVAQDANVAAARENFKQKRAEAKAAHEKLRAARQLARENHLEKKQSRLDARHEKREHRKDPAQ